MSLAVMGQYGPVKWEMAVELRRLFSERPVWTALALQERLKSAKSTVDVDLLAKVAYTFRSGALPGFDSL